MTPRIRTFSAADVRQHAITMLRCDLHPVPAARRLGIDSGTMIDRLKRIKEQTGLNLRVYNQCLQAAKGGGVRG